MAENSTLVVMAAGMGSRYGGVKQIAPMGPNGEIIIDFSVYDAVKNGFARRRRPETRRPPRAAA